MLSSFRDSPCPLPEPVATGIMGLRCRLRLLRCAPSSVPRAARLPLPLPLRLLSPTNIPSRLLSNEKEDSPAAAQGANTRPPYAVRAASFVGGSCNEMASLKTSSGIHSSHGWLGPSV